MNKNVKFLLIIVASVLLLSGCKATYNINIESDEVDETLEIISETSEKELIYETGETTFQTVYQAYKGYYQAPLIAISTYDNKYEYYDVELIDNDNVGIKYNYKFKIDEYCKSIIAYGNTESFKCNYVDNKLTINLDEITTFKTYNMINEININIKTDYYVSSNNADEVNDNIYTWKYKPSNESNNMYIVIDMNKTASENNKQIINNYLMPLYIIIFIIVAGGCALFIIRGLSKNNNKI